MSQVCRLTGRATSPVWILVCKLPWYLASVKHKHVSCDCAEACTKFPFFCAKVALRTLQDVSPLLIHQRAYTRTGAHKHICAQRYHQHNGKEKKSELTHFSLPVLFDCYLQTSLCITPELIKPLPFTSNYNNISNLFL